MKAKQYIGITGPVTNEETKFICNEFKNSGYRMDTKIIPMLGFLVSYKTLNNQPTENKRYPKLKEISNLLKETEGKVLTMIHYNSKEINSLSEQINKIFEEIYENKLCRALQLNIPWPEIKQVEAIKKQYPEMQIVFQASQKAMEKKTPSQIADGIKKYSDLINYVLIDPSAGQVKQFNLEASTTVYSQLRKQCPNLTIGFAGGLSPENVINKLIEIYQHPKLIETRYEIRESNFCTDVEGAIRDKISDTYGDDLLNLNKVKKYIQAHSKADNLLHRF